jgi:hypothetical protein
MRPAASIGEALEAATRVHDSDLLDDGRLRALTLAGVRAGRATRSMVSAPPLPVLLSH